VILMDAIVQAYMEETAQFEAILGIFNSKD
jgi:hypothetical protein